MRVYPWRGNLAFVGADIVQSPSDFAGILARVALTDDTEEEVQIVNGIQDRITAMSLSQWIAAGRREMRAEDVPLTEIAASVGTPFYVYSAATLTRHFQLFNEALAGMAHLVCFAVKANSNLAVLKLLGDLGAGMDVVSGGEYLRAKAAGVPGERIVFSGIGKTREEMRLVLEGGIRQINLESEP
ncbi:MAG: hypothetical protein P8X43_10065, partial [Maritimibacter sp.]